MPYQCNLEVAIASWRQSLKLNRSFLGDDLDELENHLRDAVESGMEDGLTEEVAYREALSRMGNFVDLEPEYKKVRLGAGRVKQSIFSEWRWMMAMFRNYLTVSFRFMKKHSVFSVINVGGLAIGLAGCLLMVLFVGQEMHFDKDIHSKEDRIYRMGGSSTGWPYAQILKAEYPEVEQVTYLRTYPSYSIKKDDQFFYEKMIYADPAFFDIFDFPLLEGDSKSALSAPFSVLLSPDLASRLFGTGQVVGEQLAFGDSHTFTVTGIIDIPENSHIQTDAIMSFETLRVVDPEGYDARMADGWLDMNVTNYVLLAQGADVSAFAEKIRSMPDEKVGEYLAAWGVEYELVLEPLTSIYLESTLGNMLGPVGSMKAIYLLIAVGFFLLMIAIINFVNLTTSRSSTRSKEIGLRKAIGADRGSVAIQFLFDSGLTSFLGAFLALVIAWGMLPIFNTFVQRSYTTPQLFSFEMMGVLFVVLILVTLVAGAYPAFLLSGIEAVSAMKGDATQKGNGAWVRQGLVGFQFSISGILIIVTLAAMTQVRFMENQSLGFDAEQVLVLDARRAPAGALNERFEVFEAALANSSMVQKVGSMWAVPGRSAWNGQLFPQ